jgi:serine/threonine protein kinase
MSKKKKFGSLCVRLDSATRSSLVSFRYEDLQEYLCESALLGRGGFALVFKGVLQTSRHGGSSYEEVAIKVLELTESNRNFFDRVQEQLEAELRTCPKYKHQNLCQLLGYSMEGPQQCLIYEFCAKGDLKGQLRTEPGSSQVPLTAAQRLRIALQTARGLEYLHVKADPPVVHRDVKTANILLDANLTAKVADFGAVRQDKLPAGHTYMHTTTPVGTAVYMPTEYRVHGQISAKVDSYAMGMVFLELLTGLHPGKNDLVDLVQNALDAERLDSVLDANAGPWPLDSAKRVAAIALHCLAAQKGRRASVEQILPDLEQLCHEIMPGEMTARKPLASGESFYHPDTGERVTQVGLTEGGGGDGASREGEGDTQDDGVVRRAKFCKDCGAANEVEGGVFCAECGAELMVLRPVVTGSVRPISPKHPPLPPGPPPPPSGPVPSAEAQQYRHPYSNVVVLFGPLQMLRKSLLTQSWVVVNCQYEPATRVLSYQEWSISSITNRYSKGSTSGSVVIAKAKILPSNEKGTSTKPAQYRFVVYAERTDGAGFSGSSTSSGGGLFKAEEMIELSCAAEADRTKWVGVMPAPDISLRREGTPPDGGDNLDTLAPNFFSWVEGRVFNEREVWRAHGADNFMFYDDKNKRWGVGSRESMQRGMGVHSQLRVASHARTPFAVTETWQMYDGERSEWEDAPDLVVESCRWADRKQAIAAAERRHAQEEAKEEAKAVAKSEDVKSIVIEGLQAPAVIEGLQATAVHHDKMGMYMLVPGRVVNGRGVWQKSVLNGEASSAADSFVLYSKNGKWGIMTEGEPRGWAKIASPSFTPDQAVGPWQVADGKGGWSEEFHLRVRATAAVEQSLLQHPLFGFGPAEPAPAPAPASAPAPALAPLPPLPPLPAPPVASTMPAGTPAVAPEAGQRHFVLEGQKPGDHQHDKMGVYELVDGRVMNSRPVWQKRNELDVLLLYSNNGKWAICDGKKDFRGWIKIASAASTPDQVRGNWQVTDGKGGWLDAPELRVRPCTAAERPLLQLPLFGSPNLGACGGGNAHDNTATAPTPPAAPPPDLFGQGASRSSAVLFDMLRDNANEDLFGPSDSIKKEKRPESAVGDGDGESAVHPFGGGGGGDGDGGAAVAGDVVNPEEEAGDSLKSSDLFGHQLRLADGGDLFSSMNSDHDNSGSNEFGRDSSGDVAAPALKAEAVSAEAGTEADAAVEAAVEVGAAPEANSNAEAYSYSSGAPDGVDTLETTGEAPAPPLPPVLPPAPAAPQPPPTPTRPSAPVTSDAAARETPSLFGGSLLGGEAEAETTGHESEATEAARVSGTQERGVDAENDGVVEAESEASAVAAEKESAREGAKKEESQEFEL